MSAQDGAFETGQVPESKTPPIHFQVLKTRKINLGDHSIIYNRVAPPVLPAPPPPTPAEVAAAGTAKAREPHKKSEILFLSATVYDRKVTAIRWWGEKGERQVFSNIDFNFLSGAGDIETTDTIYSLMLVTGNEPFDENDGTQKAAAEDWATRFGKTIPAPETFNKARSEYLVTSISE